MVAVASTMIQGVGLIFMYPADDGVAGFGAVRLNSASWVDCCGLVGW